MIRDKQYEKAYDFCRNIKGDIAGGQASDGSAKFNLYNIKKPCIGVGCNNSTFVADFLARKSVRKAIGVTDRDWLECNDFVSVMLKEDNM